MTPESAYRIASSSLPTLITGIIGPNVSSFITSYADIGVSVITPSLEAGERDTFKGQESPFAKVTWRFAEVTRQF